MQKIKKLIGSRLFIGSLIVFLQLAVIFVAVVWFRSFFVYYSALALILGVVFTIKVINTNQNMAYKFV